MAAGSPIWLREQVTLAGHPRGFHLVTDELEAALPRLAEVEVGVAHIFIEHTTAALTVNEDVEPEVLADFRSWFDEAVPEDRPYWTHTHEGPADMPGHIKAALLDTAVSVPVERGRLRLGRYQGIYLCEHLDELRPRSVVLTVWGVTRG